MALSASTVAPSAFAESPADNAAEEECRFDLTNLAAFNEYPQQLPPAPNADSISADLEEALLSKASDGTSQLIQALWSLPTKSSDLGPLALLPKQHDVTYSSVDPSIPNSHTVLPRAKTPPAPPAPTKWELFAKEKGIESRKRGRKEFDEATGEWKVRYGYGSAKNGEMETPIMDAVKDDPYADPWAHARDAKKAKVEKNTVQRMRNMERQGLAAKGAARKLEKKYESDRETRARAPAGVPVDMKSTKGGMVNRTEKRGAASTLKALALTRSSTASMGKFDEIKAGEKVKTGRLTGEQKRNKKADIRSGGVNDSERGLKVLQSVLTGSAKKEKARKQGKLSKGETGHDYDYEDGLGEQGFRKKKGRAGQGKMRKITKKNIK